MTIKLDLPPETEARLREQARASGKEVETFVRDAIEEKLAVTPNPASLTIDQKLKLWEEWVKSHPVREGVTLDDSRESIYAGRGE